MTINIYQLEMKKSVAEMPNSVKYTKVNCYGEKISQTANSTNLSFNLVTRIISSTLNSGRGIYKRAFLQHKIHFVIPKGSGKIIATAKKFVFCYTMSVIVILNDAVTC